MWTAHPRKGLRGLRTLSIAACGLLRQWDRRSHVSSPPEMLSCLDSSHITLATAAETKQEVAVCLYCFSLFALGNREEQHLQRTV